MRLRLLLLGLALSTFAEDCGPDFSVSLHGTPVFAVSAANKSCFCAGGLSTPQVVEAEDVKLGGRSLLERLAELEAIVARLQHCCAAASGAPIAATTNFVSPAASSGTTTASTGTSSTGTTSTGTTSTGTTSTGTTSTGTTANPTTSTGTTSTGTTSTGTTSTGTTGPPPIVRYGYRTLSTTIAWSGLNVVAFNVPQAMTVTHLGFQATSASGQVRLALYANDGFPGVLLASTNSASVSGGAQELALSSPKTIAAGAYYCGVYLQNSLNVYASSTSPAITRCYPNAATFPTLPNPWQYGGCLDVTTPPVCYVVGS